MKHNNTTNVVIVSSDDRLHSILSSDTSRHNSNLSFHLENDLVNLISAPNYDAYIYDIDIAQSDISSTISTISDLSNAIGNKTLILIGRKETLNVLANSQKLDGVISKTISKPVSFGQIQLAIETYFKNPKIKSATRNGSSNSSSFNLAKFSAISITIAAVAIGAYSLYKTQDNPITHSTSIAKNSNAKITDEAQSTKSIIPAVNSPTTEKINKLHQKTMAAIEDNRLSEPENDNAIYYLQKLVDLDPYDISTNQVRSKLFKRFESIYNDQLVTGNDKELRKTINSILAIEPYNHDYAVRLRELNERVYLARIAEKNKVGQQQNIISSNPNTETMIEPGSTGGMQKPIMSNL